MRALAASLPPGVHLKAVYDQSALVRDAAEGKAGGAARAMAEDDAIAAT